MGKLDQERIAESEYGLAIINDDNTSVYPMNVIQVHKGFYTAFELKRRFDAKEKRIILDSDFQREDVWDKCDQIDREGWSAYLKYTAVSNADLA